MTTTRIILADAGHFQLVFLADPTEPELMRTVSAAQPRGNRGAVVICAETSPFQEFPERRNERPQDSLVRRFDQFGAIPNTSPE